jgi:hypothetical protein
MNFASVQHDATDGWSTSKTTHNVLEGSQRSRGLTPLACHVRYLRQVSLVRNAPRTPPQLYASDVANLDTYDPTAQMFRHPLP